MAFTGALIVGAGAAVASYDAAQDQKKEAKRARADAENAKAEREAEAAKARQEAYASQQFARRQLRENSLFTGGGDMSTAGGRQTLGV
jgi:membrane protein involved in colicin uptake